MDERLKVLSDKVDVALATSEETGLKLVALSQVVYEICAPLIVASGRTPEDIEALRTKLSTDALYLSLPGANPDQSDRWTRFLSEEYSRIFTSLSLAVDLARVRQQQAEIARQEEEIARQQAELDRTESQLPRDGFFAAFRQKAED